MNFYKHASNVYDVLDITYFRNKEKNPRIAIGDMIGGEDIKVLDMCCGTLANTINLAKTHKSAQFFGIDISRQMLKKARQKIKQNDVSNVRLKCADSTDSHLPDGYFDYVIIGLALHEMNPALQKDILKEANRLLKADGRLVVLEWERPQNIVQRILFFPLLVVEQILNKSFLRFYYCDKVNFFRENRFEAVRTIYCNYSSVRELKKCESMDSCVGQKR